MIRSSIDDVINFKTSREMVKGSERQETLLYFHNRRYLSVSLVHTFSLDEKYRPPKWGFQLIVFVHK